LQLQAFRHIEFSNNNLKIIKEMTKKRSTRAKRAAYSKSPRTIYKDGQKTIQVVITKTTKRRRKRKTAKK
jgi:hypothetical protein